MTGNSEGRPQALLTRISDEIERSHAELRAQGPPDLATSLTILALARALDVIAVAVETLADTDIIERELVYRMVAGALSPVIEVTEEESYRAVVVLCGELDGSPIRVRLEPPGADLLQRARTELVHISVDYLRNDSVDPERRIRIFHGASRSAVAAKTITSRVRWEELPADVREQFIRHSRDSLSYTLFPGRN